MQVTVSLRELAETIGGLRNLMSIPMPAKYAYRFQKVIRVLEAEWNDLRQEHDRLVRQYGKPDEDGKTISVTQENMAVYTEERSQLLSEKVTLDFEPIPLSVLGDGKLSIQDMIWLDRFFYDDAVSTAESPALS